LVAIKAQQADAFIKSPDAAIAVFVIYGSDVGRISEMARKAAQHVASRSDPPGEILRIEDADLDDDPDRLLVELQTIPMFGGAKAIRTSVSRRINAAYLKPVLEGTSPPASALIVEAGNLKPSDALRKITEKLSWAAAIPCYADSIRDLSGLIDEVIRGANLKITRHAKDLLQLRLGADRALSRNEIEKLTLYAQGQAEITEADVEAIVGDASATTLDRVTLATMAGKADDAIEALTSATAAGQAAQSCLLALQRHFMTASACGRT